MSQCPVPAVPRSMRLMSLLPGTRKRVHAVIHNHVVVQIGGQQLASAVQQAQLRHARRDILRPRRARAICGSCRRDLLDNEAPSCPWCARP